MAVVLQEPEHMNLLGLMLKSILQRNLDDPKKGRKAQDLRVRVGVQAGAMKITLTAENGCFTIARGLLGQLEARVEGTTEAFLSIALGESLVGPVLGRAVRIRGNPLVLLKLLPFLRAP